MDAKYPIEDSARLLGEAALRKNPYAFLDARKAAATELLAHVASLGQNQVLGTEVVVAVGQSGFARSVLFQLAGEVVGVHFLNQSGEFQFFMPLGNMNAEPLSRVHLTFDVATGIFVSDELDSDAAPQPGQRLPRKSAVRVLVERALHHLGALPEGETA